MTTPPELPAVDLRSERLRELGETLLSLTPAQVDEAIEIAAKLLAAKAAARAATKLATSAAHESTSARDQPFDT